MANHLLLAGGIALGSVSVLALSKLLPWLQLRKKNPVETLECKCKCGAFRARLTVRTGKYLSATCFCKDCTRYLNYMNETKNAGQSLEFGATCGVQFWKNDVEVLGDSLQSVAFTKLFKDSPIRRMHCKKCFTPLLLSPEFTWYPMLVIFKHTLHPTAQVVGPPTYLLHCKNKWAEGNFPRLPQETVCHSAIAPGFMLTVLVKCLAGLFTKQGTHDPFADTKVEIVVDDE